MIYHHLFSSHKRQETVSVGLIGAGHFGTAVLTQSMDIPLLKLPIIAEQNPRVARLAFKRAGIADDDIVEADGRAEALKAMEMGKRVVVGDPLILMDLPIDVVAEGTGQPEAGARHAYEAIRHGKHVAMITKETDSVVGPVLNYMARKAGVVYTPVDGDQHGLLMGMVAWARTLGLEILAAGKARDAEYVHDRDKGTVTCEADGITVLDTITVKLAAADLWALEPISGGKAKDHISARREILADLPQPGGFDYCEIVIAANATGLAPDIADLHQPILRIPEISEALCPAGEGGILQSPGAVEVVTCLRHPHEAGMGGGVYLVVSCKTEYSQMILTTKGQIPNSLGSAALIYRPYHLCGVETPISILCAGLLGISTGSDVYEPRFDMVQKAARDFKAGEILGDDHDPDLKASLIPAQRLGGSSPLPAHMLNGNRLKCDVSAGTVFTCDMVVEPSDSVLWQLRRKQDEVFGGKSQA
ncbi:MAG: NAD(P)H-dependent oxidoreductase [Limnochordia bacterium]|jgi:predicted homoserine dehydrogenase-like protein